jgi:hypothetical protein
MPQPPPAASVAGHGHPGKPVPPQRFHSPRRRTSTAENSHEDLPSTLLVQVVHPRPTPANGGTVEVEPRVPPGGETNLVSGKQTISLHHSLAGRTVTVWAGLRSIHVILDGELLRTVASRLSPK